MFTNLISFFSNLLSYINANRLIELGGFREKKRRDREDLKKKIKVINEIRNDNVIDASDKWLRKPSDK